MKKALKKVFCFLIVSCIIIGLSGCAEVKKVVPKGDVTQTVGGDVKSSGKTQNLVKNIDKGDVDTKSPDEIFADAMADFAVKLFKNEFKAGKNTLVSPLSVLTALAITQNGADGKTLSQMEKALGGFRCDD